MRASLVLSLQMRTRGLRKAEWAEGNVQKLDCGDSCTTLAFAKKTLNCTLKMGQGSGGAWNQEEPGD